MRTSGVRGVWVRGDIMHVTMPTREARHTGAADMAHICTLDCNSQGHGWPGRMGDRDISLVASAMLLEKQRKGRGWG
jgi:hypothetical protein